MAGEKISTYILGLGGDDADLKSLMSGVKSRFRSDVAELEQITKKVTLFGDLEQSLPQVQRALDAAKAKVLQFTAEIDKFRAAGEKAPKALIDGLAAAEKAANSATKELARQQQQLQTLDTQLIRAGVNTRDLAAAQLQLAAASKVAADAAAIAAAKQALGLTTLKEVTPEIAKQRAAFDLLKNSGTLSGAEIAAAQKLLNANVKELTASVSASGGGFKTMATETKASLTSMILPITAAIAAATAFGAAIASVTDAAKAYNNELAKVGTITKLGAGELAALGADARKLAQDLGIGVVDALKSVYELIRSGVPAENAIEVLRLSALAAKAAFTDTATGAKASAVLLDAFGIEVKDLSGALDIVVRSAQTGGPTLAEFAANAGLLGNAARAVGADFKEVSAVLNVMTDASNDAAGSSTVLTKILINLNTPAVQDGLHKLGLDGKSLVEVFRGLDERGLKINDFLSLGIAGTKAAAGLAAVTNNAVKLPEALNNAATASGAVQEAVTKLADTSAERLNRLSAAYENAKIQIGETVGASSGLAVALTAVLNAFNTGTAAINAHDEAVAQQNASIKASVLDFLNYGGALDTVVTPAVGDFHQALIDAQPALANTAALIAQAVAALEVDGRALAANTPLVQKAVADQVAAIRERAAVEIELLDRSTAAMVATAAKTLEIQAKANADILDVTTKGQAAINAAVEAAINARAELERVHVARGKGNEEQYNKDVTKIRLDALTADLANSRKFQQDLIAQNQARVAAINAIEQSRLSFNQGVATSLRNIALEGESSLQQFADKQKEVERLIAEGRQIAATQGIAAAEKYFKEAQTISESLKGEVLSDGTVVQTAFQSQQAAITALKKVRDAYNEASATARAQEKAGFDDTKAKLDAIGTTIEKTQGQITVLRKEASEAIKLSIASDIAGIEAARAALAELTKPETKVITVQVVQQGGGQPAAPMAGGGMVWRQYAQMLAGGGPAFRRPNWSKVPGSGSGDTVPALLQAGSFVVRKAAAQKYGDGAMAQLARGYASGGTVSGTNADAAAVLQYAKFVRSFLKHPIFEQSRQVIGQMINYLESRGGMGDTGRVAQLLDSASFAAANYHLKDFYAKTSIGGGMFNTPDLPTFASWLASRPKTPDGPWWTWAQQRAGGGPIGTDTVPAMLTPGEWVIPPRVVKLLGGGFLNALNRIDLAPPRIPHFAGGGGVGVIPSAPAAGNGWSGGGINITINGAPADFANLSTVRRMLIPALREIQRRSGTS